MALVGRMKRKAGRKKIHDFMVTSPKTDRTEQLNPSHKCAEKMSETFLMTKQASKKGNT